ncbi:MAG: glycoside hydrolase N-terminal domain-containing protein, partial [Planctomycetota bacterium]
GFVTRTRARDWEEALISGNGTIGALAMGRPLRETVTLNHERLFMPWDDNRPIVKMAPHLSEVRRRIKLGQYRDAAEFVMDLARQQGYRGMRWTDPLVPAFDLNITMQSAGEPRDCARSVDFHTGVVTARWEDDGGVYVRRLFVSRADNLVAVSIRGDKPKAVSCRLALTATGDRRGRDSGIYDDDAEENGRDQEGDDGASIMDGVDDLQIAAQGSTLTYRSLFAKSRPDSIAGHEGVVHAIAHGGSLQAIDAELVVENADEVIVLVTLDVLQKKDDSAIERLTTELAAAAPHFDALLERHVRIHGKIFARTRLDLGGGGDHRLTSEELLQLSDVGQLHRALLEKQFDASRYAILCSSGELPPTLQGVWTGTWTPPWQSDYTHNGNVPSALASMLMANMPECMESYLGYMESLTPHFRENARTLYGCRGIMSPSRTSSHGYNIHFNEEYPHLFWTPGAAWASHFFYDYYLYTGDREFLRNRALPFMIESAIFFEDFLIEGADGEYVFSPSYSPENTPGNSDSQACLNATMDVALVKELLENLIAACKELEVDAPAVERWESMLAKMPPYRIAPDGAVQEWSTPKLHDNHEHRHISHLYALFDGLPQEIDVDPRLKAAFKQVIENRMAPRRADGGGVMSFGLVQLGQAAASLGEGDLAYEAIDLLANAYWRPNLTSTHNPGELFNVDICGGMPAVIIKMLTASRPGALHLLPALPRQWPSGRIEGVKCRGAITLDELEWNPEELTVALESAIQQEVELTVAGGIRSVVIEQGRASVTSDANAAGGRLLQLPASEKVVVSIRRQGEIRPR